MSSEAIQKAAEALKAWHGETGLDWGIDAEGAVRVVLQAMRDNPTPLMISEGESAASFGIGKPTSDDAILKVWQWMHDAALREKG